MNKPLLSICIPTFNRESCLKDCLNSIVSQFTNKEIFDQLEVVISDNGSTDNTTNVVKEFQTKFSNINIKYFRNETNIGFDRNLVSVVEKSTGEYCLTFGDDDAFFPNSFSIMLNRIKTLNVPYLMLNCWGYDHELLKPVVSHPNKQMKNDVIYKNLSDFVHSIKNYVDLLGNFGGISTQLFKRKIWVDFNNKEPYLDSQVVHFYILLTAFKDSSFALIAEPVVKTRNDNMRWDLVPGFETYSKRSESSIKLLLWMSDLYNLSLSPRKVRVYFLLRAYITSFKELVKTVLLKIGIRK